MDEIATPHDTFFRESFGRREIAGDFLRHHLPAELLAAIDLGTLEISGLARFCARGRMVFDPGLFPFSFEVYPDRKFDLQQNQQIRHP